MAKSQVIEKRSAAKQSRRRSHGRPTCQHHWRIESPRGARCPSAAARSAARSGSSATPDGLRLGQTTPARATARGVASAAAAPKVATTPTRMTRRHGRGRRLASLRLASRIRTPMRALAHSGGRFFVVSCRVVVSSMPNLSDRPHTRRQAQPVAREPRDDRVRDVLRTASSTRGSSISSDSARSSRKAITRKPRRGNVQPRIAETRGRDDQLHRPAEHRPRRRSSGTWRPSGRRGRCPSSPTSPARRSATTPSWPPRLDGVPGVTALELNISCPNVESGLEFGIDPRAAADVTAAVRRQPASRSSSS